MASVVNDVGFLRGLGTFERMAVAHLMAELEMFAVDLRLSARFRIGRGQKRLVDGTARGHRASDDELNEITA